MAHVDIDRDALAALDRVGITPVAWAFHHFGTATWHGDECGCPDSRCRGFHHDIDEPCYCLPALLGPEDRLTADTEEPRSMG